MRRQPMTRWRDALREKHPPLATDTSWHLIVTAIA